MGRRTAACVVVGVVLVALGLTLVLLAGASANDRFSAAHATCEAREVPDDVDCWGKATIVTRALDVRAAGIPVDVIGLVLATIGLGLAYAVIPARRMRDARWMAAMIVVVAYGLARAEGMLDYASCDAPGYNDASATRILTNDLATALLVTWPAAAFVISIARAAITRSNVRVHATATVVAAGTFVLALGWAISNDLC